MATGVETIEYTIVSLSGSVADSVKVNTCPSFMVWLPGEVNTGALLTTVVLTLLPLSVSFDFLRQLPIKTLNITAMIAIVNRDRC
jgi:hypothetical protein